MIFEVLTDLTLKMKNVSWKSKKFEKLKPHQEIYEKLNLNFIIIYENSLNIDEEKYSKVKVVFCFKSAPKLQLSILALLFYLNILKSRRILLYFI